MRRWIITGLAAAALAGCADGQPNRMPNPQAEEGFGGATKGQRGSVTEIFGGGPSVGNLQVGEGRQEALVGNVNRHLWQASLDTLSFMPIASTDPFTGVIATDWAATPDSPGERFKVTAYVTDITLTPSSLRVAVFREARDGELWVPTAVDAETPRRIEDAILTRARQLRIAEAEKG